ncbi:MAG: matrixin family metalloprotease [Chitinophagales bacterium]
MTYPVSIEEKEKNAPIIVLGHLKNQFPYWDAENSRIYTLNVIEVTAYFKGNNGATEIGVITTGGVVGADALHVFPRFDIYPRNEYIFFLQGDNQIIDNKNIRKKRPSFLQSETYADAQGAITKQFGLYSELHNNTKYEEQAQFDRITHLTKQSITTPDGKPFLPRTQADNKLLEELGKKKGQVKLKNPLFKDLINNPSFSLLPINTMSPNPAHGGTVNPANYLTINGSGFGTQDAVYYANADNGGQTMVASAYASDVLFWTNTSIQEKVNQNAGTGTVQVNGITSSNVLQVDWAHNCIENAYSGFSEVTRQRYFLVDMDTQGGYTFHYNTNFNNNTAAKAAFERALESWRCATHINWKPSTTTTNISSSNSADDISIITFNTGLPSGILGRSYSYFSGTATGVCNQENTLWWARKIDIEFDSPPTNGATWNFGPAPSTPFALTYDFESVALHELGHLHGLGHTIGANNDVMHYVMSNGTDNRILSMEDIAGGNAKMAYSTDNNEYCFFPNNFSEEMIALNSSNCSLSGGCLPIAVNITGNSSFCPGQSTSLNAGSYSASDSYDWSTNATSQTINVSTAGTYTVIVTDINGCTGTDSFTVTQTNEPQPNITGELSFCVGENTTLTAGDVYSSYLWSTGATSFAIMINTPGTYTLTVTDANGCTGTDTVIVSADSLPQPQITGENGFCPNETIELFAGSGFQSYLWSTGQTTPLINVGAEGIYTVTVTNSNGCSNTDTHTVFAHTPPIPNVQGDTFFCNGSNAFIFADNGFSAYLWSNGAITSGTNVSQSGTYSVLVTDSNGCTATDEIVVIKQPTPNPNITGNLQICNGSTTTLTANTGFNAYNWSNGGTSNNITVNQAGTYSVTVTDGNGCTGTQTVVVELIAELQPEIEGDLTICQGDNTLLTLNQTYSSYLWSNGSTNPSISVNQAGTYNVTVVDENGCTGTDEVTVVTNNLPQVNIEGGGSICEGESVELSVNEIFESYLWSNESENPSISVNQTGIYSVIVTDSNGCTAMDEVSIEVNPLPTPTIEGNLFFCEGASTTLSVAAIYTKIIWSNSMTTPSIEVNSAGTYKVVVTDENGCTGTNEVEVIAHPLPSPIINGISDICEGGNTELSVSAIYESYLWSNGATTPSIIVSETGTYSIEVTDANECTGTSEISTVVLNNPEPTISGSTTFCTGGSTVLDAGEGYAAYLWNTGELSQVITITTAGTYSVEVEDTNGCSGNASITINTLPLPQVSIEGNSTFCEGQSTVLDAGEGYDFYLWNTGQTSQTIEVTQAEAYSVTVTNNNNCSNSTSLVVNTIATPQPTITGNTDFCEGANTTLDAGAGFNEYLWTTGETSRMITVSTADNFGVTVTSTNGCTGMDSIQTNIFDLPTVTIAGSLSYCEGSNTTLSVTQNFVKYLWNTGATSKSIVVQTAGTYSVEVTDQNGCVNTESVDIQQTTGLTPTITGDLDICEGAFTLLDAGAGYSSHAWSTGATSRIINVTESGTYSVTVTDASGCIGVDEVTVTIHTPVSPNITGNTNFCLGESTTLDAGAGFDQYLWNTGETTRTIEVTTSGNYSVETKDANGCSASAAIAIQANIASSPIIEGATQFCVGSSTTLTTEEGYESYKWESGENTRTITVTTAGIYRVTVVDENGCEATNQVTITVLEAAVPTIQGELQFCADASTILSAPLGYATYQWSTGETSRIITVTESGDYGVLVTDFNGCTAGVLVNVEERTELQVSLTGSATLCNGNSTTLEVSENYAEYKWNTGATTKQIVVSQAGTYTVTVTDTNGCTGTTSQVVALSDSLTPTISGDLSICNTESTVLDAGDGFDTYLWSTGETSRTIETDMAGNYTVQVSNADGCSGTAMAAVELIPPFTPQILGNLTFCEGESTQLIGEIGYQAYGWSTGELDPILTVTESGMYTLVVTDTNGCTGLNHVEVNMISTPDVQITGDLQITDNESTTLDAGSYSANDEYLWHTGHTGQFLTTNIPGLYSVTVTHENDCSASAEVTVELINGIEDIAFFQEFTILPNPFNELTTLQFRTYASQHITIDLFSIEGRQLQRLFEGQVKSGNLHSIEINGGNLPAGVYVLQLVLDDTTRLYERLVVTH